MKYFVFLLTFSLLVLNCTNSNSTNTDSEVEPTAPQQPVIDYDAPFANITKNNIPVYHALVGVSNPYGGARMDFLRDKMVFEFQGKYLYIDTKNELHLVDSTDQVNLDQLHPQVQYLMKTHVYDNEAPQGTNMQRINVSFTNSESTNVSRAELADRPSWYDWDKKIEMSNFPKNCTTADVECKATNLVNNVAKMAFL